jgi:hypothetical protein
MIRKLYTKRRGVVVILACVTMAAILSVLALSLDGGSLMAERRRAQAAADAAALAGACDIFDNYWTNMGDDVGGTAKASALVTAKANGYANDGVTTIVTVNIPPASGHYKGTRGYVEVITQYNYGRSFSTIFSSEPVVVTARAVALGSPIAADVGILVLDPTSKSTFNAQGSGTSTVKGTPIVVNSTHPEAAIAGGGGTVEADKFVIAGGYDTSGGGQFIGPVYTERPGIPDPLADITPPDASTMVVQSIKKVQETSGTVNLKPGVYKGGINVSGTANLNLEPGVYYMDGGGFKFTGQGSLKGEGVMIYNDPGNGNADGISVTGQGSMILSGPTSGPYKGITFWQRRDATVTGTVAGTGGETSIKGTFYFPGALLEVSGNGGVANLGSQYISWQLNLGGNGGINIDWDPGQVAPRRSIFLVE